MVCFGVIVAKSISLTLNLKIMNKLLLMICAALVTSGVVAQQQSTVTDEELARYATVMDSVDAMSATVRNTLADMIKENGKITVARYNELSKIVNDEAKLAEAKATPEEVSFLKEVALKKQAETARINETYQSMAKEYVTVPVFNKVKKALETEPELKVKYDSLITEMAKDNPDGKQ